MQRERRQRMAFEVSEDLVFGYATVFLASTSSESKGGLFWLGSGRASCSIATPLSVSAGSRTGTAGHIRRRTTCIAFPRSNLALALTAIA